jgi:hypothetical protein
MVSPPRDKFKFVNNITARHAAILIFSHTAIGEDLIAIPPYREFFKMLHGLRDHSNGASRCERFATSAGAA